MTKLKSLMRTCVPSSETYQSSPCPASDLKFYYNLEDINLISNRLRIPWELSKDIPFTSHPIFIDLVWNHPDHMVTLTEAKRCKYVNAIAE
jgi:hypothetical protein